MAIKSIENITVTYNSVNITAYLNSASLNAVTAVLDTTNLASTSNEKIPGLTDWSIDVGGPWAKALHDAVNPDMVSPPSTLRTLVIVVGESGSQATYTWTSNSFISNYSFATDPASLFTWSGNLAVSGAPTMS